jgi:aspartokinase/homoserine dehydrogenase 1
MICDQEGIKLEAWTSLLHKGQPYQLNDMLQLISEYNLRNSIFVDVTASETVAEVYAEVLKKSVSVVTPNKIGATSPYQHYQTLKHLARKFKSKFLFETNVCAGLPVISTLNDLIKSGDRIRKIEGVFSGTLNFIFNIYDTSMKFGDVVRMAKNDGYTEPDPRLDLSGEDVMRKILILARESGYAIDFGDVACTRFVPKTCMDAESTEAFFTSLDAHESHFARLFNDAKTENKKLRYVASFDGEHAKAGLEMVDDSHPFYHLAGKDNIVLFYTERYKEQPLVIKGAGAGSEVTASGIFADVMKVANTNG